MKITVPERMMWITIPAYEIEIADPIPVPTGLVIDGGLPPDKVTASYDIRTIIDTQAKLDKLMADSGGILTVKNGGGPWFKNLAKVSLKKLICPNTWTVLFENVGVVELGYVEAVDGKTGLELKGKTHLEAELVVSRNNYRYDNADQGEGIICNDGNSSFHIKHLITSDNGDSGIDNKGVGVVDLWESDLDNGGAKNHNQLTIKSGKVSRCGRGKRTSFGFGIQSRADGGQDAITIITGAVTIENCLQPEQSLKASVVNAGQDAILELKAQVKVKKPSGYTGTVVSQVNGGVVSGQNNIVII